MLYKFIIHKEDTGYWAEAVDLEGCVSQGDTLKELQANCKEALNLYLDEPKVSSIVFSLPSDKDVDGEVMEIKVDPEIAFSVRLRAYRHTHGLSQREAYEKLGMKQIFG